jgi:hypothetical protein
MVNESTGYGIFFSQPGNVYANNRASGNDTADYGGNMSQTDGGGNYSF